LKKIFVLIGIFGAVQFLICTTYAMWIYPGGTLHDRSLESYSFLMNYFSDLGRYRTFDRTPNTACHTLFKYSVTISGICIMLFFSGLRLFFQNEKSKQLSFFVAIFGIIAGACYIGLAQYPYDGYFHVHRYYVQAGFISFLLMTIFYTMAIFQDDTYDNKYGKVFLLFILILAPQILIMIFGPRSWESPNALFLQATSQKVVVYAEILVLLYQAVGLWAKEKNMV